MKYLLYCLPLLALALLVMGAAMGRFSWLAVRTTLAGIIVLSAEFAFVVSHIFDSVACRAL